MDPSQNEQFQSANGPQGGNQRIDLENYTPMPGNGRSADLRRRLYDSGISNVPMPSVKRPIEENISSKPFSAKMNSSKIQSLSPLKKRIQDLNTSIISNLNESYREAAIEEAKYKGDGTADFYASQHIIIPQPSYVKPSNAGRKLQGRMGVSVGQPRMTGQLMHARRQSMTHQLAPLAQTDNNKLSASQIISPRFAGQDVSRIMAGPPSLVFAGFEGGVSMSQKNLEQARSKFLLDKLTGKLPERGGKAKKLTPIGGDGDADADRLVAQKSELAIKPVADVVTDLTSENSKKPKKAQKWSDLDKYIELLLDSKSEEETVFVYLVPNNKYDPYDLEVVDYGKRDKAGEKYYTLSGKGLTTYVGDKPVEFHSLGQWLIERDSYNHIKDLSFFKQFKTWKFMRMWKKRIKQNNRITAINSLEENLFMLQDHFSFHLSEHRKFMLEMSRHKFVDTLTTAEPMKIDAFAAAQEDKRTKVTKEIEKMSAKSRQNIQDCINKVLKELRQRILGEITLDEQRRKDHPQPKSTSVSMKKKDSNTSYDKLGFPAGMTYAHRSSLRKECSRFLRFAYLVDFLSLESLSQIYILSLEAMIERIQDLDSIADMEMIMTMQFDADNGAGQAPRGAEPLFYTNVTLDDHKELPESEIVQLEIDDFMPPPRGKSRDEDFDLIAHIDILEPKEDEAEEVDEYGEDDDAASGAPPVIYSKTTPNIQKFWIKLDPDQNAFSSIVIETFKDGLLAIRCFERWSKHSDLEDYAAALEEWDDLVGDNWDEPEQTTLNPSEWIESHPVQKTHEETIRTLITSAYDKAEQFLQRFQPLLEIFWRNKLFDINILVNEMTRDPVSVLQNTLRLLRFYQTHFAANLPSRTDIGLIQLDSNDIKKKLSPTPRAIQDSIEELFPRVNKERTDIVKVWLKESIKDLQKNVADVSDFVWQKQAHERISEKFQIQRDKIDLYGQFQGVLDELGYAKLKKEEKSNLTEAEQQIKKLTDIVANVESKQEQENERFKTDLKEMIPVLNSQVKRLTDDSVLPCYLDQNSDPQEMIKQLDEKLAAFKKLEETGLKYNEWQEQLGTVSTVFNNIDNLRDEVINRHLMWHSLDEWQILKDKYEKTLFVDIDDEAIAVKADYYAKIANRLDKALPPNPIQLQLSELVNTFKGAMPIVSALRNKNLQANHWVDINNLIEGEINLDEEDFTLQSLIDLDVVQYQEEIQAISVRATGEQKLVDALNEVEFAWKAQNFVTIKFKETEFEILNEIDDIYTFLDENLAQVNMILGNRYAGVVRTQAETVKAQLQKLDFCIEEWTALQKSWMYLENIFKSQDVRKALQQESQMFDQVDKFFKGFMAKVVKTVKARIIVTQSKNIVDDLKSQNEQLDIITRALQQFLETKRNAFPRFYFLSDDELLEILANSDDKTIVQKYFKALFDGIVKLTMNDLGDLTEMQSKEGEILPFSKPVKTSGNVEAWLFKAQDMMRETLIKRLKDGNRDYTGGGGKTATPRKDWVLEHPGQIVTTIALIQWCFQTEEAISQMQEDPMTLADHLKKNSEQLDELTIIIRRPTLTELERCILVALVTQDVHARDIVETLRSTNVNTVYDFTWQQQLRFYYQEDAGEDNPISIKQIQATLGYGFEYMGATSRLVITPLTDKCWITITGALHIKLGANPAGPAGTGKTESTKDLAKAMATYCVVYNCSDQVDFKMMGKHFSGLAQQGCWTCLDEFNRINVEVLSVIAQQLLSIRTGLLSGIEDCFFEGSWIKMKQEFGCHITMNPGYAGRTELPDNLKVLFRPVAMMIPSYGLIAEIMLFGEGFGESRVLSKKMTQLYKLSSEQLSQQDHYDFGMRAVKSVLVMAGGLKRANPNDNEDAVLIRAMKDANEPKFLKDDLPLFNAIVQDLFPSTVINDPDYQYFYKKMEVILRENHLQNHMKFMTKVVQLYETFVVRFGVMLVGYTGSGKTRCYETLADTMTRFRQENHPNKQFQNIRKQIINPKSISMGELYGEVDFNTQEWFDGLASKVMRSASQEENEDKIWTVFDGPVDALWIENMNTVLDDNMTLCLSNGQRLKLRPQMRMLFEVNDLKVASPATVSRCGMVYLMAEELGWRPFVKTWLQTEYPTDYPLDQELKDHLYEQFDQTIDMGVSKIRDSLKEPIKTDDLQLVRSVTNFLKALIDPQKGFKGDQKLKDLDCLMAFAFTYGLGASLDEKSKDYFDTQVREIFKIAAYPSNFTVFDYFYDLKKTKTWVPWAERVPNFTYNKDKAFFDLMVDTDVTYRHAWCVELLLENSCPAFFTGESGVGKSVVIQQTLNKLVEKGALQAIYLNFSAQTDSKRTQQTIMEKLEKISRTKLGAPPGKKNAVFVDDINMPTVETYGAQPPIEFLRLFLDKKGLYERTEWQWKEVQDTTLIAAAAPPVGGRSPLTPRFSTHFNMFCLPEATSALLQKIFGSILGGFLKVGFQEHTQSLSESVVLSTIEIYEKISAEKRATPAKFHYLFNLRDVSKVIQGCLMMKAVSCQTPDVFTKVWVHETCRVFKDRLINEEDTEWFNEQVMDNLSRNFKSAIEKDDLFGETKVMFTDALKLDAPQRYYEEIKTPEKLLKQLNNCLDEFNYSASNKMHLVFFEDAVLHIIRILRALRQPRGNIMLIGVGGSGKQSLTKLSSYMYEMQFQQIEIVKGYGEKNFNEFIKELMFTCGIDGKKVAFTMTDSQILKESFLEDINNILNTGEVPNLMLPEDKDKIQNDVRQIAVDMKIEPSQDAISQLFVARVRESFHICLCMSPVGNDLRLRCRQFPSLVNCCTLDWFSRWNEEALLYVSQTFLKELELPSEECREQLSIISKTVHTSVEACSERFYEELRRRVYTTPKSYLDLISLYLNTLKKTRDTNNANKNRLSSGMKKLNFTNEQIAELKIKLAEMQPILLQKNDDLKITLEQVSKDKAIADEKEAVVMEEKEIVEKQASSAKEIADDAEGDVRAAQPQLDKAKAAVAALSKDSIVELKSFNTPPEAVALVMEPVMILIGKKDDWKTAKNEMGDANKFLTMLKTFDVSKVQEKTLSKIRKKYFSNKDFNPDFIGGKSQPAGHLCAWILALSQYQIVYKNIVPKKAKLAEVTKILKEAQETLNEKLALVKEVKDAVAILQAKAQKLVDEKEALEANMKQSSGRMMRAEKLVVLLADEGVRWKETVIVLEEQIKNLVGDVFLSCACVSYFGGFTGSYRTQLTDAWSAECIERKIPCSETFNLVKIMGDPMVMKGWNMQGLPADKTSLENGILVTSAERYGLCIDPQEQANKWIKMMLKKDNLQIKKFGPPTLLRDLIGSVRNGMPVIIEDVEEAIDPALDPILLHSEFIADGGVKQIKLGDSIIDFDDLFNLYMTTKMPNPHYAPEVCIKVTLINFTVTQEGLEEQLLADVVVKERPDVEKKRDDIIVSMDQDNKALKAIENNILKLLNESELEQILDEDTLIDVLENAKVTSTEINARIADATIVEAEIKETREKYVPVAVRGSIIYFVIADMANINDMYQNSLQFVKVLFNKAIDQSEKSEELEERMQHLIKTITRNIYSNISRGLFEADKLVFTYLIATSIDRNDGVITPNGWNLLFRGAQPFTKEQEERKPPNPQPSTIQPLPFDLIYSIQCLVPAFDGIINHIAENEDPWKKWAVDEDPLEAILPDDWETKLTSFQKQLLIKVFRPEKLMFAFKKYVNTRMGIFFTTPQSITMEILYNDTETSTPLIFILSTGADPMANLLKFADEREMREKLDTISLGQGQEKKAIKGITDATQNGSWVVLQNCHLASGFMPTLTKLVEEFVEIENMHEDFRLFLTSMPVEFFPVSVLQNGIKVTTEPPRGLKANLKRTWAERTDAWLDDCKKPEAWRKLAFGVSFFHAIVQERRKFGPLGWNIKYEFNDSDLDTSYTMLKIFLEEEEIPWDALLYVTGKINYGGRVTDDKDLRCLSVTLEKYYCPDNLTDEYEYDETAKYKPPPTGCTVNQIKDYIDNLPADEMPSIFGLHDNANISYQRQESDLLVDKILSIQPRVAGTGTGLTPEQMVLNRAKGILDNVPEDLDRANGLKDLFKSTNNLLPSLTTVLLQEMEKFNRLLRVMRTSLKDLDKAVHGIIVMSSDLDSMFSRLQNNQVPLNWAKVAYPSLKPLASWFTDMIERVTFLQAWLENGNPSSYWISGLYFPQGFLTGVLQTHARQYRIAIDQLNFSFTIMEEETPEEIEEKPADGVYIYGCYMDGARYNRDLRCIDEQAPSVLYDPMPLMHFKPVKDYKENETEYSCPLYKTGARQGVLSTTGMSTNFVLYVEIPTNQENFLQVPTHWVRRAAAMLCQLND